MNFTFQTSLNETACKEQLRSNFLKPLETGNFFDGELKEAVFRFNYTTSYSDSSGSMRTQKKLPNCSIAGEFKGIGSGTLVDGKVTLVKGRLGIVSILFAVVALGVFLFLYVQQLPLKMLLFLIPAYAYFFVMEFIRFQTHKKEALNQFKKLFSV